MAASNRAALIARMQKILKKHYKSSPRAKRNVFEHLAFACCLENSPHAAADAAFTELQSNYFDWNEVRVSTTLELSEVMKPLNDADHSAVRLKRMLQSVFETYYSFDLDLLVKENLGKAVAKLEDLDGATPFVVAYATQHGLGGHSIPVNTGLLDSFRILGVISDAEAAKGVVPGLERAIPKNQGVEYGSIFHNLGVLFSRNQFHPTVKKILLEISPDCKDRLPKRPSKTSAAEPKTASGKKKSATAKKAAPKKSPAAAKAAKKAKPKKAAKKKPAKKKMAKKTAKTTRKTAAVKKKTTKSKVSSTKRLSKRKPK